MQTPTLSSSNQQVLIAPQALCRGFRVHVHQAAGSWTLRDTNVWMHVCIHVWIMWAAQPGPAPPSRPVHIQAPGTVLIKEMSSPSLCVQHELTGARLNNCVSFYFHPDSKRNSWNARAATCTFHHTIQRKHKMGEDSPKTSVAFISVTFLQFPLNYEK